MLCPCGAVVDTVGRAGVFGGMGSEGSPFSIASLAARANSVSVLRMALCAANGSGKPQLETVRQAIAKPRFRANFSR